MSAKNITSKTLRADVAPGGVVALAPGGIFTGYIPQTVTGSAIAVYLVAQDEEELLQGATQWPEARVSVECRASSPEIADKMGEAVIAWLRDKDRYSVMLTTGTYEASFRKEGSDEDDISQENVQDLPVASRRIIDFYLRYRKIA